MLTKIKYFLEKNKNLLLLVIPILIILVGFNGYIDPFQLRVFGDSRPVQFSNQPGQPYEYFQLNFEETLKPYYSTPFRYNWDKARFDLGESTNPDIASWVTVFLPLLISYFLATFFFRQITKNSYFSLLLWFFWVFSSFSLFTSSIHTHIIIAINFFLFYLYLFRRFLGRSDNLVNNLLYLFSGALVTILALTFEMRMIIVTFPFFGAYAGVTLWRHYFRHKNLSKTGSILWLTGGIGLINIVYFSFFFLTFGAISEQVGGIISRPSWGNGFFQLINVLAIYHPFWRIGPPVNFIYGYPDPIYFANIVLLIIAVIFSFWLLRKKTYSYLGVFLITLLFFGFMGKQNNQPIPDIYDVLYRYPYFSFSREASKYYYGYLLSLIILISSVFFNFARKRRWLQVLIVILVLLPSLTNFWLFASRSYEANTVHYPYDASVYDKINQELTKPDSYTETMWFPYHPALQYNTPKVKHYSYTSMVGQYPLNNLRKDDRNFLYYSITDNNFRRYIQMLGVEYIIIPDEKNEKILYDEYKLVYQNFDFNQFRNYLEINLQLKPYKNIDGYLIYNYRKIPLEFNIVSSLINQKHVNVGEVVVEGSEFKHEDMDLSSVSKIESLDITGSNCNSNEKKGLNFDPADRIQILQKGRQFNLSASAKYEEVPCVFLQFELPEDEVFLQLRKYEGDPIELVMFDVGYPEIINIKKVFTIDQQSIGLIPMSCGIPKCVFGIYLYGDKNLTTKLINFEGEFLTLKQKSTKIIDSQKVYFDNSTVDTLSYTKIDPSRLVGNDWVMYSYVYDPNYKLVLDGKVFTPVKNNHNLLMYDLRDFKSKINPQVKAYLTYTEENRIRPALILSQATFFFVLGGYILTQSVYLWEIYQNRKTRNKE